MKYHSFIAGLPDIRPDDTKCTITLESLKADIEECISAADREMLRLVFYAFDNCNLCTLLRGETAHWQTLGTLTREEIEDFIAFAKDGKIHQDAHLPPYFAEFMAAYLSETPLYNGMSRQDELTTLYYLHALKSPNDFAKAYFEFNLNLKNVLSATAARRHGMDVSKVVVGNTEIAENIKTNTSKDFGIAAMFPYLDETLQIEESKNLREREQKIDALRWKWLEDHTVFHYFTKEYIFAYLLRLEMLERWLKMDKETGHSAFGKYVKALVNSVEINVN